MTYTTKPALDHGQTVTTSDGATYTVTQFLGRGGQGEVYRVRGADGEYALKWYHADSFLKKINADAFHKNIRRNVMRGMPKLSSGDTAMQFIWPRKLVDWQLGSFGYLMQLFPAGYAPLSDVIMGRKRGADGEETPLVWKSWFVRLTAALNLVRAFEILHAAGLSYQDLNEGGFSVNMDNGDVMICDCDNVSPDQTNLGILGVLNYMAPEVARREKLPDRFTDQYSLAVILFRFFFHNHPMEGTESMALHADPELSRRDADLRIYGTAPHYCLDTRSRLNPPHRKAHADVRRLCRAYPTVLMQAFEQVFTRGVSDPMARLTATEWRKTLLQARDCLIQVDGREMFCHTPAGRPLPDACRTLVYPSGRLVLCMPNKLLYSYHLNEYDADFKTPVGKIIDTVKPGVIGLYNGSQKPISAEYGGQARPCPPGGRTILLPGMKLRIGALTITVE